MDYGQNRFTLELTTCAEAVEIFKQRTGEESFPFEEYGWAADTTCEDPFSTGDQVSAGIRLISKILNYKLFLNGQDEDQAWTYEIDF
jgi:hypothetical protein